MKPAVPSRGRLAPWRLWALASLILFGQLAGHVHLGVVEHSVCNEHGELVHDGDHRDTHAPASTAAETAGQRAQALPSPAGHEEHEHCLHILGTHEDWVGAGLGTLAFSRDAAERAPAAAPGTTPGAKQPRFRLAPKQSPPC